MRRKVPVLCDLKPSGKYLAVDLHLAGGIPQVMKTLLDAGLLHGECMTITGKTIAETLADLPDAPRADQDVIRPIDRPMYAQGHLAILKGNLSPRRRGGEDHRPQEPGDDRPGARLRRRAIGDGGDHGAAHRSRRRHGAALSRPEGRTRHAGDARADERAHRPGPGRVGRPHHRRAILRRHLGHGRRPRRARGPCRRHDRADPGGRLDHHRRASPAAATRGERSGARPAPCGVAGPAPRYTRGVLAKFAKNASSASRGAVLDGD